MTSGTPSPSPGFLDAFRGPGRNARLRRTRLRQAVTAVLALLAVWSLTGALRPAKVPTQSVVVASRNIPPGHTITAADLRIVQWPKDVRIPHVVTTAEATGRRTIGDIAAGEPLTSTRLPRSGWPAVAGDEQVMAIPLLDAELGALLQSGDRVDIYSPDGARLVGRAVRVVMSNTSVVRPSTPDRTSNNTVMVAVPDRDSAQLAASVASAGSLGTGLVVVIRPQR